LCADRGSLPVSAASGGSGSPADEHDWLIEHAAMVCITPVVHMACKEVAGSPRRPRHERSAESKRRLVARGLGPACRSPPSPGTTASMRRGAAASGKRQPSPERVDRLHSPAFLGRPMNRRCGQRCIPQVLLRDLDRHAAGDRMAGGRVAHPVRAGLREPLCPLRIALPSQHAGAVGKECLDRVPPRQNSCRLYFPADDPQRSDKDKCLVQASHKNASLEFRLDTLGSLRAPE
jgi:hypothetical protein